MIHTKVKPLIPFWTAIIRTLTCLQTLWASSAATAKLWLWCMDHYGPQIIHCLCQVVLCHSKHKCICAASLRWYRPCSHNISTISRGAVASIIRDKVSVSSTHTSVWSALVTIENEAVVKHRTSWALCIVAVLKNQGWDLYPSLWFLCTAKTLICPLKSSQVFQLGCLLSWMIWKVIKHQASSSLQVWGRCCLSLSSLPSVLSFVEKNSNSVSRIGS